MKNEELKVTSAGSAKNSSNESVTKDLQAIVTENLKNLARQNGTTQRELAARVGYSEAAVSKYFNGSQFPSIDFLFQLKRHYNISIDEFISRRILEPIPEDEVAKASKLEQEKNVEIQLYRKYAGNYILYYLDTSNYKGRDNNSAAESLVYGVLNIHEVKTNLGKSEFECVAFFGIHDRKEATELKEKLDELSRNKETYDKELAEFIKNEKEHRGNIYHGSFEFGYEHAYISLKYGNVDRAFIVLYKVQTNKPYFNGGLGVVNSGSKGREKMPTAQFIALSRFPISLSEEEIHHQLLLTYPTLQADNEIKELINMFKSTYLSGDKDEVFLSEYQKELMMKTYLEDTIKKIISQNMNRYAKASERDDSIWYKLLKREDQLRNRKNDNNEIK